MCLESNKNSKKKKENMPREEDKETRKKKKKKVFTLLLVVDDENERVLLGEKKTGFGKGFWNGFGGKVEESDPTVLAAALRELEEEACIQALDAKEVGRITFIWIDEPEKPPWLVHIFRADTYSGQERETEEMRPQWFPFDAANSGDLVGGVGDVCDGSGDGGGFPGADRGQDVG